MLQCSTREGEVIGVEDRIVDGERIFPLPEVLSFKLTDDSFPSPF